MGKRARVGDFRTPRESARQVGLLDVEMSGVLVVSVVGGWCHFVVGDVLVA